MLTVLLDAHADAPAAVNEPGFDALDETGLTRLLDLYQPPAPDWLRINLIVSVSGSAAGPDGTSESLTNRTDRRILGVIRRQADLVVVGAASVRAEGYRIPATATLGIVTGTGDLAGHRIEASDTNVDLDTSDVDLALRYSLPGARVDNAERLFGEQLTVVASPWLLKSGTRLDRVEDVAQFTLIEAGDAHRTQHMEWLTWRRWFDQQGLKKLEPKRWLFFNYAHQILQAALTGQGIALARMPLVADSLASGDLVEVLPRQRMDSPLAYWLLTGQRSAQRPEVKAFCEWLRLESAATRQTIGEVPDPDTLDNLD